MLDFTASMKMARYIVLNAQRLHKEGKPGSVRGVKHGQAKLTPEIVLDLRHRHKMGESFKALARELGVDPETVTRAIKRKTWEHV